MKLSEVKNGFLLALSPVYGKEEALTFFKRLAEFRWEWKPFELSLNADTILSKADLDFVKDVQERLSAREPVQYILGETWFYGLKFKVTPDTLIPRPETESLVNWILEDHPKGAGRVLDIGTGSGCIAIALARNLRDTRVTAIDISKSALEVAAENAKSNLAEVEFRRADILGKTPGEGISDGEPPCFEVIVSNPPYVRELEKAEMERNVLEFEPHGALFVSDEDPLVFYRAIGRFAVDKLCPGGQLYLEINQYLGQATLELLNDLGFTQVELRKDLFGNDRMIKAVK